MNFNIYLRRILHDKVKIAMIIFLIILPLADIGVIAYGELQSAEVVFPDGRFASFNALCSIGTDHFLNRIYIWFLPLYLLIISGEDSLEDYDTGYKNILVTCSGKKNYVKKKAAYSFMVSAIIVFISLIINYIAVIIIFRPGGYVSWTMEDVEPGYVIYYATLYPVISNIINILLISLFAGMIGMIGNLMAVAIHNRKIVYGITFLIWFIFDGMPYGFSEVLHPFSGAPVMKWFVALVILFAGYLFIASALIYSEVNSDEV